MDSTMIVNLWPPTSYGRHPSLYRDLPESEIERLEKAIFLRMVFDFEGSLRIFAALDERQGNHPAVALEHGITLCDYKKFDRAFRAFQKALDYAKQKVPLALKADEYLLLRMWQGLAEMHLSTTLASAWVSMKDARERLRMLSLDAYTDVQVGCVVLYYGMARTFSTLSSGFPNATFGDVPVGPNRSLNWQGITHLRKSLQRQGRLTEAFSLLRMETNLIQSNRAKLRPWQDFVAASRESAPIQPLWLLEGTARLSLADLWIELGGLTEAEQEIDQADALFQSGLTEIPAEHNSNIHVNVEYARMKLNYNDTSMLVIWEDFSRRAIETEHHYPVGIESLDLAADLAYTLLRQKEGSADSVSTFHRLQTRLDTLDIKSGDAFARVQHQHRVARDACASGTGLGLTTRWYQDFAKNHSECQLWSLIQHFMLAEIRYYRIIGDGQSWLASILRFTKFLDGHAKFWEEQSPSSSNVLNRKAMVAPGIFWMTLDTGTDLPCDETDLQFPPGMQDDLDMMTDWTGEMLNTECNRLRGRPARTLFSWMRQGIRGGHLTSANLEHVLDCHPSDGTYRVLLDAQSDPIIEDADIDQVMDKIFFREGHPVSVTQWETTFSILRRWLLRAPHTERQRNYAIGLLQRFRTASLIERLPVENDIAAVGGTLQTEIERFHELYAALPGDAQSDLAETHHELLGISSILGSFQDEPDQLHQALEVQMQLLEYSRQNRQLSTQARTHAVMAMMCWSKSLGEAVNVDGLWDIATQAFEHLDAAEELYDELRRDILRRGGLDAVKEALLFSNQFHFGQALVGHSMVGMVYGLAIQISELTRIVGPRSWGKMWEWIQRAKGRTMSEFMGVGPVIPARLEDPSGLSKTAQELLQEEERLVGRLAGASLPDRSPVRQALNTVREKQAKLPELQNIADYPGRNPILLEDLAFISQLTGENVLFVDWYFDGRRFSMVTASQGTPKPHELDNSLPRNLSEVFRDLFSPGFHAKTLLDNPEAHSTLLKLNAFVAPIAQESRPGDLVVLCPSSRLHLIPLHALEVDGEPLIRRNPVVYCHNLSSLRSNFLARQNHDADFSRPGKIALFGDPNGDGSGRKAVISLGERLHTPVQLTEQSTRGAVSTALADLRMIHYHGHTKFAEDATKHALLLHDAPLTAQDIFELNKSRAPYHATLLSCESGRAQCLGLDDLIGIVPALLRHGAASVVSTLWNIQNDDAATFSRVFYEEFGKRPGLCKKVIHYAKAAQRATLAILDDKERSNLYHWAPFVFHGCWLSRVPPEVHTVKIFAREELHLAAEKGDVSQIQRLLRLRTSQDAKDIALLEATRNGHLAIVNMLIGAGANANFRSALGEDALHIAAANNQVDVIRVLLSNGANILTRGTRGDTAIHTAARSGNTAAVQELSVHMNGAAASVLNDEGETAQAITRKKDDISTTIALSSGEIIDGCLYGSFEEARERSEEVNKWILEDIQVRLGPQS